MHDAVESREEARRTGEQLLQVLSITKVTLWSIDRHSKVLMVRSHSSYALLATDYTATD